MKFESTRGGEKGLSFEEVLFAGFASDGGLYMPATVPNVSLKEFHDWATLPYDLLTYQVLRKFISRDEIEDEDLKGVIQSSFTRFYHPSVIGTKQLSCDLSIFELFHGPTLAFKDLGMFVVAGLIDFFMKRREKHMIAVVATAGDTGSSALEAIRGRNNMDIIVMLPKDRCSRIQRLHMTTVQDRNTHLFCVDGNSDEMDVTVKRCFEDHNFASDNHLISLNSINMGRILAQIPIYIYAYYCLVARPGEDAEIVVPTGAAGSITAGSLASMMGYPLRLVSAVNVNEVVARTLRDGIFSVSDNVQQTFSCAIDIQVPYNLERIVYLFSGRDSELVKTLMEEVEKKGRSVVPEKTMEAMRKVIAEYHVATDEEVKKVIRKVKTDFDYFVCPHTAIALDYCFSNPNKQDIPRGVLATASPEKFPEAVAASGFEAPQRRVQHLFSKQEKFAELTKNDDWFLALKEKILSITKSKMSILTRDLHP